MPRTPAPATVPPRSAALAVLCTLVMTPGCADMGGGRGPDAAPPGDRHPVFPDRGAFSGLPAEPRATASSAFWERWGDGRAELSGYRIRLPRYGEMRDGRLVLIYVTEPHDRRRWIKDDSVAEPHRVNVMKLNASLEFQTGIYPYSVLTSVFAPVDDWGRERFSPVKLLLGAQEWCGGYHHVVWPGPERLRSIRLSYFASEGEAVRSPSAPAGTLYEDALLVQLRELDGPFAGGGDWEGWIVPGLWRLRAGHRPVEPVRATIRRDEVRRGGRDVTRFALGYGDYTRTFYVEREPPRRVLGWTTSEGEEAELLDTERLPYWRLNAEGDEAARARLGLPIRTHAAPEAAAASSGGSSGAGGC